MEGNHHLATIALFLVFGFAAIVPEAFFAPSVFASPSVFFAPAMFLAGIFVWTIGLVPRGIPFSPRRVAGAALLAFLSYPIGYLAIAAGFLAVFTVALSSPDVPSGTHPNWLQFFGGYALLVGVLFAGGVLTLLIVAASFFVATLCWPRRALVWIASLSATATLGGVLAAVVKSKFLFPTEPIVSAHAFDLLLDRAWNIPLAALIGQPLLAGLIGHWLYLVSSGD